MDKFPAAHIEVIQSFYVDDFESGANSGQEAKELCIQLCELFLDAGMVLRRWNCSSPAVMDAVPDELKDRESEAGSHSLKALGFHWDTNQDELFVATPEVNQTGIITKRDVAKAVASIYDVLGYHLGRSLAELYYRSYGLRRQIGMNQFQLPFNRNGSAGLVI